jgi:tetratricopeptide (TPR) repeat protein
MPRTAPGATAPAAATASPAAAATAPPEGASPAPPERAVPNRSPMRAEVPVPVFNASVDHLNACIKLIDTGHHDLGISECRAAVTTWDGNHLAWYAMASGYLAKQEWPEAQAAAARAVKLRPDQAMYQLYYGMALYEVEMQRVGNEAARRDRKGAAIVDSTRAAKDEATGTAAGEAAAEALIDSPELRLDAARDALWRATQLAPRLWRAHYYLGRVYRDLDDSRHAAEAFTHAIALHPQYRASYLALSELYRSWEYFDQALAVARLGAAVLPADAEVWYEVGMAYDAKRADDAAIAAFSKVLAERPGDVRSSFQRGQIYLRIGDTASARRDLEAVAASSDPQSADARSIAIQLLARLRH